MITPELADRIDRLTQQSVRSFNRMVEAELVGGRLSIRYVVTRQEYERDLEKLGRAMTEAVGEPRNRFEYFWALDRVEEVVKLRRRRNCRHRKHEDDQSIRAAQLIA